MAQIPFRVNLQGMTFPLLSELSGRTVIVGDRDHTYMLDMSVPRDGQVPIDRAIPQVYYAHNVMPSTFGFQSVGYEVEYTGIDWIGEDPIPVRFYDRDQIQAGRIDDNRAVPLNFKTYIAIGGVGTKGVFTLDPATKKWKLAKGAPDVTANTRITVATVNGVSYIFFSYLGAYIYNSTDNTLIRRTLAGLDETTILGLIASNGYLMAYSEAAIAWSSVVDVEDFVVSDVSGAGGGNVQEARGRIVTAVPTALGLILFTDVNAVSVLYSGNADFPWNFKSIASSGGIAEQHLVSDEQLSGYYQTYSTNGLQQIAHNGARTIFPWITDFISGRLFEDYDNETKKVVVTPLSWDMRKSLAVIADRYLVLSYGMDPNGPLTHALVMDVTQNRLGKLRIEHSTCFELRALNVSSEETPRGSLAFLQPDGTIRTVDFNVFKEAEDSVMLLGKYQYVRQRWLELFTLELENIKAGDNFQITAQSTLDGKNVQDSLTQVGALLTEAPNYREYGFDGVVGHNVSLLLEGTFNAISLVLWLGTHGGK